MAVTQNKPRNPITSQGFLHVVERLLAFRVWGSLNGKNMYRVFNGFYLQELYVSSIYEIQGLGALNESFSA